MLNALTSMTSIEGEGSGGSSCLQNTWGLIREGLDGQVRARTQGEEEGPVDLAVLDLYFLEHNMARPMVRYLTDSVSREGGAKDITRGSGRGAYLPVWFRAENAHGTQVQ